MVASRLACSTHHYNLVNGWQEWSWIASCSNEQNILFVISVSQELRKKKEHWTDWGGRSSKKRPAVQIL